MLDDAQTLPKPSPAQPAVPVQTPQMLPTISTPPPTSVSPHVNNPHATPPPTPPPPPSQTPEP